MVPLLIAFVSCRGPAADNPRAETRVLPNGIRLLDVFFPHSTNVAIFTYLPLGLVTDGPHQAQWSHLLEHLVVQSTIGGDLSKANAETLPDHMRLDYYGTTENWREGLTHHQKWLEGVPFTEASLQAERPKIKAEVDYTTKRFATHKFAWAAWAQALRHNQTNAALQGDIRRVGLKEIEAYRNEHLVVFSNTVVCIVGGIEPARVFALASDRLGAIRSNARPAAAVKLHPGKREITWDLNARHLLLTWSIPAVAADEFPALLAAAQWLNLQLSSDPKLKQAIGMVFAGADLATPEGNSFYVSASLRPGASFPVTQKLLQQYVHYLSSSERDLSLVPMLAKQLAGSLTIVPNPAAMSGRWPPNLTPAMFEMNVGLQWGMNEFRYGPRKPALARRLSEVNEHDVRQAATKFLTRSACSVTTLQPEAQ